MSNASSGLYTFGSYRLDAASRVLTRSGAVVTLAPKTFDLLVLMAESGGRLLSKRELMEALWNGTFVEEANLSFQVSSLRKALGEEGNHWIEAVPKYGYRFKAPRGAIAAAETRDPEVVRPPSSGIAVPRTRSQVAGLVDYCRCSTCGCRWNRGLADLVSKTRGRVRVTRGSRNQLPWS